VVEKVQQSFAVKQSIPSKEVLDKNINDNQFGVNMNDFMPVCVFFFKRVEIKLNKSSILRKMKILVKLRHLI
jgi:hypothetical protein